MWVLAVPVTHNLLGKPLSFTRMVQKMKWRTQKWGWGYYDFKFMACIPHCCIDATCCTVLPHDKAVPFWSLLQMWQYIFFPLAMKCTMVGPFTAQAILRLFMCLLERGWWCMIFVESFWGPEKPILLSFLLNSVNVSQLLQTNAGYLHIYLSKGKSWAVKLGHEIGFLLYCKVFKTECCAKTCL